MTLDEVEVMAGGLTAISWHLAFERYHLILSIAKIHLISSRQYFLFLFLFLFRFRFRFLTPTLPGRLKYSRSATTRPLRSVAHHAQVSTQIYQQ